MSLIKTFAGAAIAAMVALPALAKDDVLPSGDTVFTKWGDAEGWTVFVDSTNRTCLIEKVDELENVVQMGLTKDHSHGYLGVFSKMDIGVTKGTETIFVAFDDSIYEGEARTQTKHLPKGYTGGYFLTDNPEFVDDVMRKYEMVVFPEKEYAFVINLAGSMKAIEAARECNKELNP